MVPLHAAAPRRHRTNRAKGCTTAETKPRELGLVVASVAAGWLVRVRAACLLLSVGVVASRQVVRL